MTPSTPRARTLRKNGTKAENGLWYVLRNRNLAGHKFVRQLPVGPYFADFACREQGLIIEVDGGQHANAPVDAKRTALLNAEGYSVLRFWNNEVLNNREGVIAAIQAVLEGNPSPDLRFAPADLSPTGRGMRGVAAAASSRLATSESTITIAAAVILDGADRMLVVRKRGSDVFMQPGGKIEAGETPLRALRRELEEEVSLSMAAAEGHGTYSANAANEPGAIVVAHVFSARTGAVPRLAAEIEAMCWIDPNHPGDIALAPLTRDHMLPLAQRLAARAAGDLR